MNVTLSVDEQLVSRARKKARVLGKSLNELIRDYLQKLVGGDDPERRVQAPVGPGPLSWLAF